MCCARYEFLQIEIINAMHTTYKVNIKVTTCPFKGSLPQKNRFILCSILYLDMNLSPPNVFKILDLAFFSKFEQCAIAEHLNRGTDLTVI